MSLQFSTYLFTQFQVLRGLSSDQRCNSESTEREKNASSRRMTKKKSSKSSSKSGLVSKVKSDIPVSIVSLSSSFTLQRRLSTATTVKYDMYLMNLGNDVESFWFSQIGQKEEFSSLSSRSSQARKMLTRFEDLPMGSFVMFVSHQWNSFNHPDPNGRQMQVLSKCFVI